MNEINNNETRTVSVRDLMESLHMNKEHIAGSFFKAVLRTRQEYIDANDDAFFNCEEAVFEETYLRKYRDDLIAELTGTMVTEAIRNQLNLWASQNASHNAMEIATELLDKSIFGEAFQESYDILYDLLSDETVKRELYFTRDQARGWSNHNIDVEAFMLEDTRFENVNKSDWEKIKDSVSHAHFLSKNDLIRMIIFRETGFPLTSREYAADFELFMEENGLPLKINIMRNGIRSLAASIEEYVNAGGYGATYLLKEAQRINTEAGCNLVEINPNGMAEYTKDLKADTAEDSANNS